MMLVSSGGARIFTNGEETKGVKNLFCCVINSLILYRRGFG